MSGHSDAGALSEVLWADAELRSTLVDYEEVRIRLVESTGLERTVICHGYIGYAMAGFWDEVVVERAEIVSEDSFLLECVRNLETRHRQGLFDSGSPERNRRSWKVLNIYLSDGAVLKIAAAAFEVTQTVSGWKP
jgi:hypothetical protein